MDKEADLMRENVWEHLTAVVSSEMVIGGIGAVVTLDESTDGYYLVEWTCDPYICQDSKQLLVEGYYLNEVERAPGWYTKSKLSDKHLMKHVVMGCVTMH